MPLSLPVAAETAAVVGTLPDSQVAAWHQRAGQGDVEALYSLGQHFRQGIDAEQDLDRSRQYYLEAARLGHAKAQLKLGTLSYPEDRSSDYAESRHWWELAARQGLPEAQYRLAILAMKQPEPDPLEALAWMTQAARAGLPQAVVGASILAQEQPSISDSMLDERISRLNADMGAPAVTQPAEQMPEAPGTVVDQPESSAVTGPVESESAVQTEAVAAASVPSAPESVPVSGPEEAVPPGETETSVQGTSLMIAGKYGVQLAALVKEDVARAEAGRLSQRHEAILEDFPVQVHKVRGGYKVRVAGFADRKSAGMMCRQLQARKQPCFVVTL